MRKHKYETLADDLRREADALPPNQAMPSERELMNRYGVSRMTVRAAMARLIDEGRVYNVHGAGTFVTGSRDVVSKAPRLTSFTEDMASRGLSASSKILVLELVDDTTVASRMRLPPEAQLVHLRSVQLADDEPMAIEDAYIPTSVLEIEQVARAESLYGQLAKSGHEPWRAEQTVSASVPTENDRALLKIGPDVAAIIVERVISTKRGNVVEYERTLYRADQYSFHFVVKHDRRDDQESVG